MIDRIEIIGDAIIQHGHHNDRVYLMKLGKAEPSELLEVLDGLAVSNGYGKVFAKIPGEAGSLFQAAGYRVEAEIPRLFNGRIDGLFVAKYFSKEREQADLPGELRQLIQAGISEHPSQRHHYRVKPGLGAGVSECGPSDTEEMATLYGRVFESYPFPVKNPVYLRHMMQQGVRYFSFRDNKMIVSLAAAEIDVDDSYAEMTDFATLPDLRGRGFASELLAHMERFVSGQGTKTTFTIARASSYGMNAVFKKNGYRYAGFLKNNTQISGAIQSMTVWFKHLDTKVGRTK